jgi:glycosyltransferase involved in cell wall biosynthesis
VLISIITPTFNAGVTLGETLESVRQQMGEDMEHLLLDACSTDRTLDVVKQFSHLVVHSEPDSGIYDGMNKGAELARGDWLLFLQGDDWLAEGTLEAYRTAIASYPDAEMICGNCEAVKESEGSWSAIWSVSDSASKKLTIENIALGEPMINARLIRRDIFWKLGGFSLEYSLASDRDFLLRAAEAGVRQGEIQIPTYRYRWHSRSSTMTEGNSLSAKLRQENIRIAQRHLLDTKQLTSDDRKSLRTWHTRLTIQAAMNAMESMRPDFFALCFDGTSNNARWPVSFLYELMSSIPGFIARGCRTRSQVMQRK